MKWRCDVALLVVVLVVYIDASLSCLWRVFFFNDTATNGIYTYIHTLSLHDALPISTTGCTKRSRAKHRSAAPRSRRANGHASPTARIASGRSAEHTSELQSLMRTSYAVFCLKTKTITTSNSIHYHRISYSGLLTTPCTTIYPIKNIILFDILF